MFTEKCFILKFSENLANKLAELGHNVIRLSEPRYIVCDKNDVYLTNLLPDKDVEEYIDCGTNEDLFLTIASIRNDNSDYSGLIDKGLAIDSSGLNIYYYWLYMYKLKNFNEIKIEPLKIVRLNDEEFIKIMKPIMCNICRRIFNPKDEEKIKSKEIDTMLDFTWEVILNK